MDKTLMIVKFVLPLFFQRNIYGCKCYRNCSVCYIVLVIRQDTRFTHKIMWVSNNNSSLNISLTLMQRLPQI